MKQILLALFLLVISALCLIAQSDYHPKDIDDRYVEALMAKHEKTREDKFRNHALKFFREGTPLNDSLFSDGQVFVGVGLQNDAIHPKVKGPFLNIMAIRYKDTREEDFHKRIYFAGIHGFSHNYLICNNAEEVEIYREAIESYFKQHRVPHDNGAYKFMETYQAPEEEYGRLYMTDRISAVSVGPTAHNYMRQNGDYIIHIQCFMDSDQDSDPKKMYVTDYILKHWYTINIYMANGKSKQVFDFME